MEASSESKGQDRERLGRGIRYVTLWPIYPWCTGISLLGRVDLVGLGDALTAGHGWFWPVRVPG